MNRTLTDLKKFLLSGVSYAIPFVACGGILIAASIAFVPMTAHGPDFSNAPFWRLLNQIGAAAFSLLIPVLAGYIAFGMADRPGLEPVLAARALHHSLDAQDPETRQRAMALQLLNLELDLIEPWLAAMLRPCCHAGMG